MKKKKLGSSGFIKRAILLKHSTLFIYNRFVDYYFNTILL